MCKSADFDYDTYHYYIGVSIDKRKWDPQQIQILWKAAVEVISAIHSRGVVITDLKPAHFIISPVGFFVVDYGCAYFAGEGRIIALMLSTHAFSSTRETTHFGDPVSIFVRYNNHTTHHTTTVQPYNNHTTIIQQPYHYNYHTTTIPYNYHTTIIQQPYNNQLPPHIFSNQTHNLYNTKLHQQHKLCF